MLGCFIRQSMTDIMSSDSSAHAHSTPAYLNIRWTLPPSRSLRSSWDTLQKKPSILWESDSVMQNMRVCLWVWLSWIPHMLTAIRLTSSPKETGVSLTSLPSFAASLLSFFPSFLFPISFFLFHIGQFLEFDSVRLPLPSPFPRTQLGANFLAIPVQCSWPVARFLRMHE